MSTSPDKLFRDRLEPLRTTPPPMAWNRVVVDMQKQRRRRAIIFWNALGVLLLTVACVGWLITPNPAEAPKPLKQDIHLPAPAMAESGIDSQGSISPSEIGTPSATITSKKEIRSANKSLPIAGNTIVSPANSDSVDIPVARTIVEYISAPENKHEVTISNNFAAAVATSGNATTVSSKIVYSANDTARFKRKPKPAPVDTTRSALQRVIDIAYEIKNENTWLGDFRQMKDELLTRPGNGPARDK